MRPVRLALLGTGAMSDYQHKKFAALEGVEVTACFDADAGKAERFARDHGIASPCSRLDKLLDLPLDAVSCCLVDAGHFVAGDLVLKRGLALFCEKPLSNTVVNARELARLGSAEGAVAMVNLSKRNAPALHALKADVESKALGDLVAIDARYHQGWVVTKVWGDWSVEPRWKWRLQSEFCTAGVAGDLGVHLVDALMFLFGVPEAARLNRAHDLASARAAGLVPWPVPVGFETPAQGNHPAYVDLSATLSFGGIPCMFSTSWIDPSAVDSFRILVQGTVATAVLDLERSRTSYTLLKPEREVLGPAVQPTYEAFIDAVRRGRSGTPGVGEALAAQEALESLLAGVPA